MYEAVISKVPAPVSITNFPSASVTPPMSVPSIITFAPTSKATRDFSILADQIEELEHDTTLTGGLQFFVERLAAAQTTES